tara:strand:- start:1063 stop:2415 length:1353 start_codon:yes stop_codon:yes gene_type:complete
MFDIFSKRAVSYQAAWGAGDDWSLGGSLADTQVNSETALQINAIFSAISLISDTVATLPMDSFTRTDGARAPFRPKPSWMTRPDIDTTPAAFWGAVIVSLMLDGNAFIRVFSRNGRVVNLNVLSPSAVEIKRNGIGRVMFKVENEDRLLTSDEIIFIPDIVRPGHIRGVSRVNSLKQNWGLALALENYASKFFGSGTQTSGVIEFPGSLTAEQAAALQNGFDSRHKGWKGAHKTAIISGGAKYVQTSVENDKAQFLDSRRLAVEDVARAFNVPPHLLGLPGTTSYASVEQNNLGWVTHGLRPIVSKLESAFTPLLERETGGEDAFIRFNLDGLLRADINSRMSAYSVGLQSGFLTINDVRKLEELTPVNDPTADTVRVPLANVNVDAADLTAQNQRVTMAQKLIIAGFDPAEALAAMGLPQIAHTGVPSVQLQGIAQINPDDPTSEYKVD